MTYTMALCDGFDHYALADAARKWRYVTGAFTLVPGPYHGNAARFEGGDNHLEPGRATAGVASRGGSANLYIHSDGWGATEHVSPLQLIRRVSSVRTVKQALWVHADGSVSVRRMPSEAVVVASAAGVFPLDAWTHVCYSSSLSTTTTGRCDVWVNETLVASATALQTCDAFPATATDLRLGNCLADGNTVTVDADDYAAMHRFDTTGPDPDPPLSTMVVPHAVLALYPSGPGDAAEFPTVVGAATHWAASAEAEGDGDTSYVEEALGANPMDLYQMPPYPASMPELPEHRLSAEGWGFRAPLWALVAPVVGGNGEFTTAARYVDEDGDPWTDNTTGPIDSTWPTAWQYQAGSVDTSASGMATLQVGWGGSEWATANDEAFRGSQLVVELWYPASAFVPPAVGGQRWSAAWIKTS